MNFALLQEICKTGKPSKPASNNIVDNGEITKSTDFRMSFVLL